MRDIRMTEKQEFEPPAFGLAVFLRYGGCGRRVRFVSDRICGGIYMDIKVIVVDNSPELKERLTSILRAMEGVEFLGSFDDAVAAMQFVEENPVDLVFSDVVMPEISGITLASMIYEREVHPEVVLLSGIPGFSLEAWKIRAFGFIIKPYTRARIGDMIKKYRLAVKEGLLNRDVVYQGA